MLLSTTRRSGLTLLAVVCLTACPASADVIYVDADAVGAGDGSSWENAYPDLGDALTTAQSGDQIWVGAGTYTPAPPGGDRQATFQLISGVAIYGGFAGGETSLDERDVEANASVLSGDLNADDDMDGGSPDDNSYHVVTSIGSDDSTVLDGLTIRAGNANGEYPDPISFGGGMYSDDAAPTVVACTFVGNHAAALGGGFYSEGGHPNLIGCSFEANTVSPEWGGGGLCVNGDITVSDCLISNNSAGTGGGILLIDGESLLIGCTIADNWASITGGGVACKPLENSEPALSITGCIIERNGAAQLGGGAFFTEMGPLIADSIFSENTAGDGGGLWVGATLEHCVIDDCLFVGNSASSFGGALHAHTAPIDLSNAIFVDNSADSIAGAAYLELSEATLVNCLFRGNSSLLGGALASRLSDVTMTNATMINNTADFFGGGIYGLSGHDIVGLVNSILWENSVAGTIDETAQIYIAGGTPNANYCCIQGWTGQWGGEGNTGVDPEFSDDDGRLSPGSPVVDTGSNDAVPEDVTTDLDGNDRIVDGTSNGQATVDMGAYEFQDICEGDANHDGVVDPLDSGYVLARFGCEVGVGDPECDTADQNDDGTVDPLDVGFILARFGPCPSAHTFQ